MKRLDRWIDGILRDVLDFLVEFWAPSWTWRRPVYNSTPIVLLIRAAEAIICERHLDWLKQRINTRSPLSFFLSYVLRFEHSLATSILEQWSDVNFRDCLSRIVCNTEPPWKSTLNFLAGVANIISITRSWVYFLGPFWPFQVAAAANKTLVLPWEPSIWRRTRLKLTTVDSVLFLHVNSK